MVILPCNRLLATAVISLRVPSYECPPADTSAILHAPFLLMAVISPGAVHNSQPPDRAAYSILVLK
jgi:hypothetical protein